MAPKSVAGEEGNVRNVAHAVTESGLETGLGVTLARSAHHTGGRWRAGEAAARAATAARDGQQAVLGSRRSAAEAARSVLGGISQEVGEQNSGTGIVPRNLRDIGYGRPVRRRIRGAPIGAVCAFISVDKIGAAHGDRILGNGKAADADSVRGSGCPRVAGGRAFVAGGYEYRNSRGGGILKRGVVRGVGGGAVLGFALAIAHADNGWRFARGNQVLNRDQPAEGGSGIGAGGHLDGGIGSRGAGPLGVQFGLDIVAVGPRIETIIGAGRRRRMHRRERSAGIAGKPEGLAERGPVGGAIHVAIFHHGDGLARAGSAAERRSHVVDGGQVGGNHGVVGAAAGREGIAGPRFVVRVRHKVVHRHHAFHHLRQRFRNHRVAHVGDMFRAIHVELVDLGVEGRP